MSANANKFQPAISTLIKATIGKHGPQTFRQLYTNLLRDYPSEAGELSYSQFKKKYLRNLKNFGHIIVKPIQDKELMQELAKNPLETRVTVSSKEAWLVRLHPSFAKKYAQDEQEGVTQGGVDLSKSHSEILAQIAQERHKSKIFWEGKSDEPHDWRAAVKKLGHPESLTKRH
ncbi:hypothetical protein EV182_007464 [Spiromyces aspiralis]|uniref:Uncharacterized protein n=1 Tax=Spiromyces aspiralis TaxID=68401 RepID=A0ACC1HJQ2_9FUNG|nr:hypothetical protein EV182_007464 [Spiromyces aspiralis]